MRRFVEIFVLAAGLAGVGTWVWSEVRLYNSQKAASRTLEHKLAPPHVLESGELLGRLTILRLKLESVVREGAGEKTLDVALGHIPGTVLPGGAGNVGITGHRDTLFRGLRHIARNDVIQLQTTTGAYSYQVEDTSIVKPEDVGVLNPGPHPELTLVTCCPFYYVGPAPDRFIVKARLVTPPPVPVRPAAVIQQAVVAEPPTAKPTPRTQLPAGILRVRFEVHERHSRAVAPGILMGLSSADARHRRANGWLWVALERRTIWARNQAANQPLVFRRSSDGKTPELMITNVTNNAVAGYLLLF